jgi:LmbE family N-acetylglucosaminyl deacetylase
VGDLGTILGIWAHPDDEVYLSGGVMAAARTRASAWSASRRPAASTAPTDPVAWPPDRLARSGTRARSVARRPRRARAPVPRRRGRALRHAAGLPIVERLIAIIREVRPDTILTFGPDG